MTLQVIMLSKSILRDTLKPRYSEPRYSEFRNIVNKTSSHFEDLLSILHLI